MRQQYLLAHESAANDALTGLRRAAYPAETPTVNPPPEAIMPAYLFLMGDDSLGVTGRAFDAR